MKRVIAAMVELIVRCCDPEEVLLFGSHAKGAGRADSDIDLLVVHACPGGERALRHEIEDLLVPFPVAVDVHVLTPSTARAAWADTGCFVHSILSSSVPVHVRSGSSILDDLKAPGTRLTPAAGGVESVLSERT